MSDRGHFHDGAFQGWGRTNSSGISLTLCGQEPSTQAKEIAHGSICWGLPGTPATTQALRESTRTGDNQKILAEARDGSVREPFKVREASHLSGWAWPMRKAEFPSGRLEILGDFMTLCLRVWFKWLWQSILWFNYKHMAFYEEVVYTKVCIIKWALIWKETRYRWGYIN